MIVLGSTGSIGVNTLNIAREFNLEVETLVAGRNYQLLQEQINEFRPKYVVVADKEVATKVEHDNILFGEESILEVITKSSSDLVVNALVGFLGLKPTIVSIKLGKRVALANKESLVVAGKFIDISKIDAIDSEHFGLWYLMQNRPINKLVITASGGSFRDIPLESLKSVNVKDALNHPNWKMGNKITIDSATMVNKVFEAIEAKWLFGIDKIDAVIEKSSIVHSLVEFKDGSTTAHLSNADMRLPIAFAILKKFDKQILKPLELTKLRDIVFHNIDIDRYRVWSLKDELIKNPDLGVLINASNEVGVEAFLNEKIGFLDISKIIFKTVNKFSNIRVSGLDDIFEIDREVRRFCQLDMIKN